MAAANGQPQGTKREFTPEQKRTFALLGVAGVLALGVGIMYLPGLLRGNSSSSTSDTPTTTPVSTKPSPSSVPPLGGAPGASSDESPVTPGTSPGTAPAAGGAVVKSALGYTPPVARSRRDPFQNFVLISVIPTPLPAPPAPTPIPQVSIPRPSSSVAVPQPGGSLSPFNVSGSRVALPGAGGASDSSGGPLVLPEVNIPRMNLVRTTPQNAFPPPRSTENGGGGEPQPSFDKRLSGVIISNGVRALLEITRGTETVTHVVQPGDTVEGIQILNIERFNDGTRTVTRMTVRENGQDHYVELKPGADRTTGGIDGPGGAGIPGAPGGRSRRTNPNPFQ